MKLNTKWIMAWGAASVLFGAACSDEENNSGRMPDGGTADAAPIGEGGVGSTGEGGSGEVTEHAPQPASVEYLCTPGMPGACNNQNDCPGVLDGSAKAASSACGLECLEDEEPEQCSLDCIETATGSTSECASCFGPLFDCIVENCFAPCVQGTNAECQECTRSKPEGMTCFGVFSDCSGNDLNPAFESK